MQHFELFTLRYYSYRQNMGVPVRTSNGHPRWLKYEIRHAVKEMMPSWPLVKADISEGEFTARYREELNQTGIEKLASRFRAIALAEGDPRLVLMCYEDITKPGQYCHRRSFAGWWEELTGEQVRELGPTEVTDTPTEAGLW